MGLVLAMNSGFSHAEVPRVQGILSKYLQQIASQEPQKSGSGHSTRYGIAEFTGNKKYLPNSQNRKQLSETFIPLYKKVNAAVTGIQGEMKIRVLAIAVPAKNVIDFTNVELARVRLLLFPGRARPSMPR